MSQHDASGHVTWPGAQPNSLSRSSFSFSCFSSSLLLFIEASSAMKPRDYCCCAIPIVNAGIYATLIEQFVLGILVGILSMVTPAGTFLLLMNSASIHHIF